jgi:two-component system, NarL family, invasion response regulator UvrY
MAQWVTAYALLILRSVRRYPMIRLAIAEDHTIVRWALREALGKAEDIEVVGEAGTAAETLEMVKRERPEVLLLDISLPDRSGFDVLSELRPLETAPLVVVLTWHTEPSYAARAIAAGAHGYLTKSVDPTALLSAIRAVSRGEQVIPPGVEQMLASGDGHPASALTAREQQVMEMLARGLTNREIAEHLEISIKTVDTHRGHVLKKLGLRNNSELTRFAVKHGYVSL